MGGTSRAILDITSSYLAAGFLGAGLFLTYTLWRDWNGGMRDTTREAWIGLVILAYGLGLHFEVAFFVFHTKGQLTELLMVLLVVRTILLATGMLVVVRAWTRRVWNEWGWVAVVLFMVIVGHVQDMLGDMLL